METHLGGEHSHKDNFSRIIILWKHLKCKQNQVNIPFKYVLHKYVLQYNGFTRNARSYLHDVFPTTDIIYE